MEKIANYGVLLSATFQGYDAVSQVCHRTVTDEIMLAAMRTWTNTHKIPGDVSSRPCFNQVRTWLNGCQENHSACASPHRGPRFHPTRFIYVGSSRDATSCWLQISAEQPSDAPYVALSHCWSSAQFTVLMTTNKRNGNLKCA